MKKLCKKILCRWKIHKSSSIYAGIRQLQDVKSNTAPPVQTNTIKYNTWNTHALKIREYKCGRCQEYSYFL